MHALWLEDQELTYRTDLPVPEPSADEALIRVLLAGICSTDLEMIQGYYPFTGVLGHEFVGQVEEAPKAPEWVGKRVAGEINIVCGDCAQCRAGRPTHCVNRQALGIKGHNGVFAEYFTLPLENLHLVPEEVSDREAVFTEPLAAAVEIPQQVHIRPTDRVLVVGAGRLGQLIAQVMSLTAAQLMVVARHDYQRELLAEHQIAFIPEIEVERHMADLVVDATGSPGGFKLARKAVRPRGTIVLKSTYAGNLDFDASSLVVDEISLVGSRCGPFPPALELLRKKMVDPTLLIEEVYSLSEGLEALEKAAQSGVLKVLLAP
jgi:threonine dehydrogenase-like Zn-dependent dehydrogenase